MRFEMLELHAGVHISNKEIAVQPNFAIHNVENEPWIQRHQQSPQIVILKVVCRFVVLLLSTFSGFSIFTAGFLCLWQLCSLLCRPPQRSTERSRIIDARRCSCSIACGLKRRDNFLAWGDVVCELL